MLHVRRGAEEVEGSFVRVQAREEEDGRALGGVVLVALARFAVGAGDGLALPVHEVAGDRVVAVAGGRGEVAAGLVEREGEEVRLGVLGPEHAGLPGGDLGGLADAEGREDLEPRVAGVDRQGDLGVARQRRGQVGDAVLQGGEEGLDLGEDLGVGPEKGASVRK